MRHKISTGALLFAFLLASGCADDVTTEHVEPAVVESTLRLNSQRPSEWDADMKRRFSFAAFELKQLIDGADTWQAADRAVTDYLSTYGNDLTRASAEQVAAAYMLSGALLPQAEVASSEALLKTTGRYTNMLVRTGSPQFEMLLRSFEQLEGHWSADQLLQAVDAVLTTADEQEPCSDCEAALNKATPSIGSAALQAGDRDTAAVEELRDLRARLAAS